MGHERERTEDDRFAVDTAAASGAFASVLAAPTLAEATDQVIRDGEVMRYWLSRYTGQPLDKLQGRAFEYLETLKFNERAARVASDLRANTTQMHTPTGPVDIEILKGPGEEVVREVQAKSYSDPSMAIRSLADAKYKGQGRLVPAEQEAAIRERLGRRSAERLSESQQDDVQQNLMGQLEHEDVASGGTTRAEAEFAGRHPDLAVRLLEGRAALAEVGAASGKGALVAGGFGLTFATMSNGLAAARGEKDAHEAIVDTTRATVTAATRGGAVAGGARAIAILGRQSGFTTFASGTGPAAIAASGFEVGSCVSRYVKGDIEGDELWEGTGGAILRGTSAYYCGIAGQLLIPIPVVGALVGSVVGYTTAAILIQSGLLGMGPANAIAGEERRRREIETICSHSVEKMAECRIEIERLIADEARQFESTLLPALDQFESQLVLGTTEGAVASLAEINNALRLNVPFRDFAEFDAFMRDPDRPLPL